MLFILDSPSWCRNKARYCKIPTVLPDELKIYVNTVDFERCQQDKSFLLLLVFLVICHYKTPTYERVMDEL